MLSSPAVQPEASPDRGRDSAPRSAAGTAGWHTALLLLIALGGTVAVYRALLDVAFFSDDFISLVAIANRSPLHFIFEPFGGHLYIVRNLVFWLMDQAFGF